MNKLSITIHHTIFINRSREEVWDFTQDYSKRTTWDKNVLVATVVQSTPQRIVQLKTQGNIIMTFAYKLDDRPTKTALAIKEIDSKWMEGGGGSWSYTDKDGGTLWSQTNTLIFKPGIMTWLFLPWFKLLLQRQVQRAMRRAKSLLEGQ